MGKLNLDKMKSELEAESQSNFSNTGFDKLQQGKNVRRVLWPKGDKDSFYSEGYLHFGLGSEGKSVATCPKTWGSKEKCPICEYVEQLQKSKNKDDKKLANDIKAKRRIYINVLNRDDEEDGDTPKVLPIGVMTLKGILETICDADYGDITDPEDGRDITIIRKGKGLQTTYSVLPKPKSSEACEDKTPEELEEEMTDLDSLFIKKSYEELESILNGDDEDDDDDDEDEDDEDEDSEDDGYDSMTQEELTALCKKRKIKIPAKANRLKLITLLEKFDESDEEDNEGEEDSEEEAESEDESSGEDDDEDGDDVKDAIAAALAKRKGRGRK